MRGGELVHDCIAAKTGEPLVTHFARGSFQVLGVFEVYEQVEELATQINAARNTAWFAIVISMTLLYLVLVGLIGMLAFRRKDL